VRKFPQALFTGREHGSYVDAVNSDRTPDWHSDFEDLARRLSDRYYLRVDSGRQGSAVRYIATARRLGVRSYSVVTADPAELRAMLGVL
jgi:hypothetical protein